MSSPPRILLAGLGLLVVAAVGVVASGVLAPSDDAAQGLTPAGGGGPAVAAVDDGPGDGTTRAVVAPTRAAALDVRVMGPEGALVPAARIVATAPDGTTALETTGRGLFEDLEPGTWKLRVESAGYPTYDGSVLVEPGTTTRKVVRLGAKVRVEGRVVDRFGEPRPSLRVWALRPGEAHPAVDGGARGLASVVSDRDGRFRLELEPGSWRLSLGPAGEVRHAMGAPQALWPGGPEEVEVVLPGTARLEVVVGGVAATAEDPLTVQVLERYTPPDPAAGAEALPAAGLDGHAAGVSLTEIEHARRERLRAAGGTGSTQAGVEVADQLPSLPEPPRPEWVGRSTRRLGSDGRAVFTELAPRTEYRLAVKRPGLQAESGQVLSLRAEERTTVELTLPAALDVGSGTTDATQAGPLPLALHVRSAPLRPDERPAGFFWR